MSSYLRSPFQIETDRLQGIVRSCNAELERAVRDLEMERQRIADRERQRFIEEENFSHDKIQSEEEYQREKNETIKNTEIKRQKMRKQLNTLKSQLSVMEKRGVISQEMEQRYEQLNFLLENKQINAEELGQKIQEYEQQLDTVIKRKTVHVSYHSDYEIENASGSFGMTGVSLQLHGETEQKQVQESPEKVFEKKLQMVLASSYSRNLPAIRKIQREYAEIPEYKKTAYAVMHKKELDEYLRKIEALSNNDKHGIKKREQLILQYEAVCKVLDIQPEKRLLEDERSTRKILQLYQELSKKHQDQRKHQYVAAAVAKVMERYNMVFEDSRESAFGQQMTFATEHASIQVDETNSNQVVMQVTGEYTGNQPTLDDRRKSVTAAKTLCSLMKNIEKDLKEEYGIVFGNGITEEPSEETIQMKKAAGKTAEKKYHTAPKQMQL